MITNLSFNNSKHLLLPFRRVLSWRTSGLHWDLRLRHWNTGVQNLTLQFSQIWRSLSCPLALAFCLQRFSLKWRWKTCQYPLLGRIYSTTQGLVGNPVLRWDFYQRCRRKYTGHFESHQGGKSSSKDALAFHANVIVAKIHLRTGQNFRFTSPCFEWVVFVISDEEQRYDGITWYHNMFFWENECRFGASNFWRPPPKQKLFCKITLPSAPRTGGIQSLCTVSIFSREAWFIER